MVIGRMQRYFVSTYAKVNYLNERNWGGKQRSNAWETYRAHVDALMFTRHKRSRTLFDIDLNTNSHFNIINIVIIKCVYLSKRAALTQESL